MNIHSVKLIQWCWAVWVKLPLEALVASSTSWWRCPVIISNNVLCNCQKYLRQALISLDEALVQELRILKSILLECYQMALRHCHGIATRWYFSLMAPTPASIPRNSNIRSDCRFWYLIRTLKLNSVSVSVRSTCRGVYVLTCLVTLAHRRFAHI